MPYRLSFWYFVGAISSSQDTGGNIGWMRGTKKHHQYIQIHVLVKSLVSWLEILFEKTLLLLYFIKFLNNHFNKVKKQVMAIKFVLMVF